MLSKRAEERKRKVMRATIEGLRDHARFDCYILDVSASGCRIDCNHLDELPDTVCLQPVGLDRPMMGQIVWRSRKLAGLHFDWEEQDPEKFLHDIHTSQDDDPAHAADVPGTDAHVLDAEAAGAGS